MARRVIAPNNNSNGVTNVGSRYALTKGQVNTFLTELHSPNFINNIIKLFTNPIDNVVALNMFPFDVKQLSPVWSALAVAVERNYINIV